MRETDDDSEERSVPLVYTNGLGATAKAPRRQLRRSIMPFVAPELSNFISPERRKISSWFQRRWKDQILSFRMSHLLGQSAQNSPNQLISNIFHLQFWWFFVIFYIKTLFAQCSPARNREPASNYICMPNFSLLGVKFVGSWPGHIYIYIASQVELTRTPRLPPFPKGTGGSSKIDLKDHFVLKWTSFGAYLA